MHDHISCLSQPLSLEQHLIRQEFVGQRHQSCLEEFLEQNYRAEVLGRIEKVIVVERLTVAAVAKSNDETWKRMLKSKGAALLTR